MMKVIAELKKAGVAPRDAKHVGRLTDLGEMGTIFHETAKKCVMAMSWCCHGLEARIRLRIDSYDDLLLPGHRLLAQLPVFASVEHFENKIFATPPKWRVSVL